MIRGLRLPLWLEVMAAIVLALVVSTVVTVYVFQREDAARTTQANVGNLFERTADAVSALERAPVELRPELLTAFSRVTRYITLDAQPMIGNTGRDAVAENRITALLPIAMRRDVRVKPVAGDEAHRLTAEIPPWPKSASTAGIDVGDVTMIISIDAGQAGWVNVRYLAPIPTPRYAPALLSGLVAASVMVLAAWWTHARFATPLQKLTEGATALRRGEPVPEIPQGGPPAVRAATRSFNAMSQRLTATLENQRSIMAAVAHDLRTPIASMRLRVEFVADGEERARLLESLDEMQTMTEAVLSAASADRTGETARPVDITALVQSLADDMKDMGGDVSFQPSGAVRCVCRTNEVRRAVRNLIENALRYGVRARVAVTNDREFAFVSVDDDGPGIPPGDIDRVLEPFVRLESSRSAQTGGYGLGLSIARWITRGHGGDVVLRNRSGGGLSAMIRLPLQG